MNFQWVICIQRKKKIPAPPWKSERFRMKIAWATDGIITKFRLLVINGESGVERTIAPYITYFDNFLVYRRNICRLKHFDI